MAAQDFETWLHSTTYEEYPLFAVEGMRAAWTAAEEKFNSTAQSGPTNKQCTPFSCDAEEEAYREGGC